MLRNQDGPFRSFPTLEPKKGNESRRSVERTGLLRTMQHSGPQDATKYQLHLVRNLVRFATWPMLLPRETLYRGVRRLGQRYCCLEISSWVGQRWGDALTRLRSYPLTALKSPTLGMKSVGDVARALGVSNSKVRCVRTTLCAEFPPHAPTYPRVHAFSVLGKLVVLLPRRVL